MYKRLMLSFAVKFLENLNQMVSDHSPRETFTGVYLLVCFHCPSEDTLLVPVGGCARIIH